MHRHRAIRAHYEKTLAAGGEHSAMVDWADPESQRKRFEVLADNVLLEGRSLLDVGCGLGDLLIFLQQHDIAVRYTGVDIVEKMVLAAKDNNPAGRFLHADILAQEVFTPGSLDVVFGSGLFNLNLGNHMQFLAQALDVLLPLARELLAFNLLHCRARRKYDYCVYYDPQEVLALLAARCCNVQLIDNYLPNDFTVICRKASLSPPR